MSINRVRDYLAGFGRDKDIIIRETSTATVELAAAALGTIPARIAKSLAVRGNAEGEYILLVTAGDAKLDNKKFRDAFGLKPKMLSPDETYRATGYTVGGVCPFDLTEKSDLTIVLDQSLRRFDFVYPACGDANSAIKTTLEELERYTNNPTWVDACKDWDETL